MKPPQFSYATAGKLSTEEAVELAAQVAEMAKAGLPLAEGLRAVADEVPRGRLGGVLREISGQLDAGTSLNAAIEAQGNRLPPHVRGLLIAGVRSGRLAEVLEEFVEMKRSQVELRRRVRACLAYPLVLMTVTAALFLLLQGCVVPQMAEVFEDFDAALPFITQVFIASSGPGAWIVECGVSLVAAIMVLSWATPRVPLAPRLLYWVPLVGPLWRWSRLTQFSRLMGLLLGQEVPLPAALRLVAVGVGDAYLAAGCRRAAIEIEQGRALSESLASIRQFPPSMIPLVEWGERTSSQSDAFYAAAEMFGGRVQSQGSFLEVVLAPIVFVIILTFVLFFVTAMFMPLISMINGLS